MSECCHVRVSGTVFLLNFNPLFFQRSALRGWFLMGLRHFFVLRCAVFEQKLTRTQALPLADADSAV